MGNYYPTPKPANDTGTIGGGYVRRGEPSRRVVGTPANDNTKTMPVINRPSNVIPFPREATMAYQVGRAIFRRHAVGMLIETALPLIIGQFLPDEIPATWTVPAEWASGDVYICPTSGPPEGGSSGIWYTQVIGSNLANCINNQAVPVSPGGHNNLGIGFWTTVGSIPGRWTHVRSYRRLNGNFNDPIPAYVPAIQPAPVPFRMPYRWPDFWPSINVSPRDVKAARAAYPDFGPAPSPWPQQQAAPGRPRPPGPGTKEKKGFILALDPRGLPAKLLNGVTESMDVLRCANKALPKKLRAHPGSKPQAMAANVYTHWGSVDMTEFLMCVAENTGEDRFFGHVGNSTRQANRSRGSAAGIAFGPAL